MQDFFLVTVLKSFGFVMLQPAVVVEIRKTKVILITLET